MRQITEANRDAADVADANGKSIGRVDIRTIVAEMVTSVSHAPGNRDACS